MQTAAADFSRDILECSYSSLRESLSPKAVALIGASEEAGSIGRTFLENLLAGQFRGAVYPVNPKHKRLLGTKCYPTIEAVPGSVELAVIATPAPSVPEIVEQCARAQVKGAVVGCAGFKDYNISGVETQIQAVRGKMRIIGPDSLGLMIPHLGLNATLSAGMPKPGRVAFLSQSGSLCTAILDWSLREGVGFSAFLSTGSMLDVGWGELIDYFGNDPHTRSIVCYMESVGDARAFLSAAREVSFTKPIIVLKVGRTEAAAKAAGSLTGSDAVLDAAFQRCGILRVESIAELFDMAEVLSKQPRATGPRLAIVTNAGGPAALATDRLIASGGTPATLGPATCTALNAFLPAGWSHSNPVDILGEADPDIYSRATEAAIQDPETDGVLVILTPNAKTDPEGTARRIADLAGKGNKPILTSWMGGSRLDSSRAVLNAAGVPTYDYPDAAAHTFAMMWRYSEGIRLLYERPVLPLVEDETAKSREAVERLLTRIRKSKRTVLTKIESGKVLTAYGIPTRSRTVPGYADPSELRLFLGSRIDGQFGPIVLFGSAGELERAIAIPPLNTLLARRLIEQTRIHPALCRAGDSRPVLDSLTELIVRFSHLVTAQRTLIAEVTVNPLVISSQGMLALHAGIVLHSPTVREKAIPRPAIRPYPVEYISRIRLRNGTAVELRPICPEDETMLATFHTTLSADSIAFRYFSAFSLEARTRHERLARICFADYDREIALVATRKTRNRPPELIAVGRLNRFRGRNVAEFALLISDDWQNLGLGRQLLSALIEIGHAEKLSQIVGTILADNAAMLTLARRAGFQLRLDGEVAEYIAELKL